MDGENTNFQKVSKRNRQNILMLSEQMVTEPKRTWVRFHDTTCREVTVFLSLWLLRKQPALGGPSPQPLGHRTLFPCTFFSSFVPLFIPSFTNSYCVFYVCAGHWENNSEQNPAHSHANGIDILRGGRLQSKDEKNNSKLCLGAG